MSIHAFRGAKLTLTSFPSQRKDISHSRETMETSRAEYIVIVECFDNLCRFLTSWRRGDKRKKGVINRYRRGGEREQV